MITQINGYPIIAFQTTPKAPATRAGAVILVDRGNCHQPYVTAWVGQDDGIWDTSWHHGHYFDDKEQAMFDFASRVKQGY